jgi:flagellar L-ring protein precursor FlgH
MNSHLRIISTLTAAVCAVALAGCGNTLPAKRGDDTQYVAVRPPMPMPPERTHGAIYQAGHATALFEDNKARRIGDILTVVLTENTNARKSATATTTKDQSIALADPTVFGRSLLPQGGTLPRIPFIPSLDVGVEGNREFEGQGSAAQSNQLTGSITVSVAEVLPNGYLVVQGEKWVKINQGQEYVRVRGIVRPVDIKADNTVESTQIGDAQIAYGGTGALADSNQQGWLARFFNSPFWLF